MKRSESTKGIPSDFKHLCFRFIAGPPSRYEKVQCAWMLDKEVAGGGCTMNLAVHFVDFFCFSLEAMFKPWYALMNNRTHHKGIEDYSLMVLTAKDGTVGVVETGYTFLQTPGDNGRLVSVSVGEELLRHQPRNIACHLTGDGNRRTMIWESRLSRIFSTPFS